MKTLLNFGSLGILSLAGALFAGGSAKAQCPGSPYLGYWPYPGFTYNSINNDYVPYFALHPPVYYSLPVPRTFGYSPFAYPPGTMTPEIVAPGPAEIINPHVPQTPKQDAKPTSNKTAASKPRVIVNPYVTPDAKVSAAVSGE